MFPLSRQWQLPCSQIVAPTPATLRQQLLPVRLADVHFPENQRKMTILKSYAFLAEGRVDNKNAEDLGPH